MNPKPDPPPELFIVPEGRIREIECANGIVSVGDHAFSMARAYRGQWPAGVHGRVVRIGPDELAYSDPAAFERLSTTPCPSYHQALEARPSVLYGPTFVVIAYFDGDQILERHRFLPREVFVVHP